MSVRKDGRGHWPRGKRRSPLTRAQRQLALVAIRHALRAGYSRAQIARTIRVADTTIGHWLRGITHPMPASLKKIRALPRT